MIDLKELGSAAGLTYVSKMIFLIANLILLYIFLTPRRSVPFQVGAFVTVWAAIKSLRLLLRPLDLDPLLDSYIMGSLFLIPTTLVFRETFQVKVFVFFLNYCLSQLTYLLFMFIGQLLSPALPQIYALGGLTLEMAALPLVNRYAKMPVREIAGAISSRNPAFTLVPILSFLLLASYGVQRIYVPSTFITLTLSTILIFFAFKFGGRGNLNQQSPELVLIRSERHSPRITVKCFGSFAIYRDGCPLNCKNAKAREILAYLVHRQGEAVGWEKIVEAVWPDCQYERAHVSFHSAMYRLRKFLSEHSLLDILDCGRDSYRIYPGKIDCDMYEFSRILGKIENAPSADAQLCETVKRLYCGGYFEEDGFDWAYAKAAKLEISYLEFCDQNAAELLKDVNGFI
ncbi:MAG TPA: hypothetical protein DDW65_25350 [Firmicutes bacterium]|jgi:hypothetical protein|nr:hypothetical protein [Bacillota bacterium]